MHVTKNSATAQLRDVLIPDRTVCQAGLSAVMTLPASMRTN
jgi:hypothetical protein